jgi:hypothetical protein
VKDVKGWKEVDLSGGGGRCSDVKWSRNMKRQPGAGK